VLGERYVRTLWTEFKPSRRDELITLARYGKITPEEAEAEAAARGEEPFARQPQLPAFDPMAESRWTIVMAVAWIAWRDFRLVRENCPGFSAEATHWVFRHWNEAAGTEFRPQKGWWLETWSEATTVRLALLEAALEAKDEMPATAQMPARDAQNVLWQALLDGHLVAEARDQDGRPTDIPAREWSYLNLFEDGKRDALKYDALDRREPFTEVKLKRDDLLRLWPAVTVAAVQPEAERLITPEMLEPLTTPYLAGYVPLCVALHWIMTEAGTLTVHFDDAEAWAASVAELHPLICGGEVELIGKPRGGSLTERIPGSALALVKILAPLQQSIGDIVLEAPSHIDCSYFLGQENWAKRFNDRLYETGKPAPTWTHLQVSKAEVLARWPKPQPVVKTEAACCRWLVGEMQQSPKVRTKAKAAFWSDARTRFPTIGKRQFDRAWDKAIGESGAPEWAKAGRPRAKSNHHTK
jgi:hypothetical protein